MNPAHMSADIRELPIPLNIQNPTGSILFPQNCSGSLRASNFARAKPLYAESLLISISPTHGFRGLRFIDLMLCSLGLLAAACSSCTLSSSDRENNPDLKY
jgi:hypothetical protein